MAAILRTTSAEPAVIEPVLGLLGELFDGIDPPVAVRLWDGSEYRSADSDPRLTIVLNRPEALRRMLRSGSEAALVAAHLDGDIDLVGDIFAAKRIGRTLLARQRGVRRRLGLALRALAVRRTLARHAGHHREGEPMAEGGAPLLRGVRHSPERDRAAVTHHYDVSNRFYSTFLDPGMVYSCAVFDDPSEPLERAQQRKVDLVCRKLRLRPGQRFLDVGCGWGSLIMHAAREYHVDAVGITLSERQAELARERIRDAGLGDRCRVELRDYRTVPGEAAYDAVASIGMFEHVGSSAAAGYFAAIERLLRPGGVYLHHAISSDPRVQRQRGPTLSDHFVFPDSELVPLGQVIAIAEQAGLEVRDVESLREHYALTLRRWFDALEARHDELAAEVGEATWRAWRLVFAGAATAFDDGEHRVLQTLMVKPDPAGRAGLPLLRTDWY